MKTKFLTKLEDAVNSLMTVQAINKSKLLGADGNNQLWEHSQSGDEYMGMFETQLGLILNNCKRRAFNWACEVAATANQHASFDPVAFRDCRHGFYEGKPAIFLYSFADVRQEDMHDDEEIPYNTLVVLL